MYLSLGYFFGEAAERLFVRVRGFAPQVVVTVVLVGLVWALREWSLFRPRSGEDRPEAPDVEP